MNHRAAGGRDCQGRAGDPERPGDQGTRGPRRRWMGWMGWRAGSVDGLAPGEAVEITESAGEIGRSDRWRTAFCLAVSRSRLESSLRIPGQRRGGSSFQLQAGQGRAEGGVEGGEAREQWSPDRNVE